MTPRVFLSHSSKEKDDIQALRKALRDLGIDAWEDVLSLRIGDDRSAVAAAVREATGFVLLLSPASIGTDWVQREINWALETMMGRPDYRLMVLLRGMEPPVLKLLFGAAEPLALKYPEGTPPEEAAMLIAQALGRMPQDLSSRPSPQPAAPMAELILDFSRPHLHEEDGKHRAAAQLRVRYDPAERGARAVQGESIDFVSPLGPIEAEELRWYIESYPRWPFGPFRDRAQRVEGLLKRWGRELFDAIRPKQDAPLAAFLTLHPGRVEHRITVCAADAGPDASPEAREAAALLLGLPWELLADKNSYLFEGTLQARVRRSLPAERSFAPVEPRAPVRVLLVIARPEEEGVSFLNPRASALPLVDALLDLGSAVELEILPDGALETLREALNSASDEERPYQVVHFDGHGIYDARLGLGLLCFENAEDAREGRLQRRVHKVGADQFGAMLRDARVPLFVLEACQTAVAQVDPRASVAAELLRAGVVSVVAMRHAVLVATSSRFVEAFYGALAEGARVGTAMVRAQHALRDNPGRLQFGKHGRLDVQDWMVPVLFQEEQDPQLFPGGIDMRPAAVEARREKARVKRGELPDPPAHGFVGRARALLEIERRLARTRYLTIVGAGGQGKTALATEAARWWLLSGRCERVAFVSVERLSEARPVLDALGRQLVPGYSVAKAEGTGTEEERRRRATLPVKGALAERRTVIVVDNLESILKSGGGAQSAEVEEILGLVRELGEVGETRVLLTSRESVPAPLAGNEQRLGALSATEAKELLAGVLRAAGKDPPRPEEKEDEALDALIEAVGGHARSLVLLAGRVLEGGLRATADALRRAMEEIEKEHPGEREKSLLASVRISLDRLDAETRQKIRPLGVFRRAAHVDVLAHVLQETREESLNICVRIVACGLAQKEGPFLLPDPALGPMLLNEMRPHERGDAEQRWKEGMVSLGHALHNMQFKDAKLAAWSTFLSLEELLRALDALTGDASTSPANAETAIGYAVRIESLISARGTPRALARIRKARAALAEMLPNWSHARFLAELQELNRVLDSGMLDRALEIAKNLLDKTGRPDQQNYPEATFDRGLAWKAIGRVFMETGHANDALAAGDEAQRIFNILGESGDQDALRMESISIAEQAHVLANLGHFDRAEAKYIDGIRAARDRGDVRTIAVLRAQLGNTYLLQGRTSEAISSYREAIIEFSTLHEPASVAIAWHQIGMAHKSADQPEAAEDSYQRALAIWAEIGHRIGEASTLHQLGTLYWRQHRYEEALKLLRQAAHAYIELGNHTRFIGTQSNLAAILGELGHLDDAREVILAVIDTENKLNISVEPWKTWSILTFIERSAGQAAKAAEAHQQASKLYTSYRRNGGAPTSEKARHIAFLGTILREHGPNALRAALPEPAEDPAEEPALLRALYQLASGSRDAALADDPALIPTDAVELRLVLESLPPIPNP